MKTTLKKIVGRLLIAFLCWGAISLCQQYAYAGETTQGKVLRDATVCIYRASDLIKYFDENGQPKEEFRYNLPPRYNGTIIGKQDNGEGVVLTCAATRLLKDIEPKDLMKKAWWIVLQPVHDDQGKTVKMVYAMGATCRDISGDDGSLVMTIPSDEGKNEKGNKCPHLPKEFPNLQESDLETTDGDDCFCLTYSGRTEEMETDTVEEVQKFLGWLRKSIVKDDGSVESNQVRYSDDNQTGHLLAYMHATRSFLKVGRVDKIYAKSARITLTGANVGTNLGAIVYSEKINNPVALSTFSFDAELSAPKITSILVDLKNKNILPKGESTRISGAGKKTDEPKKTDTPSFNFGKDTIIYGAIGLLGVVLTIVLDLLFRSKFTAGRGNFL